jgi:uncharacterized YccA/Bax inhibitor family protein
VRSSNPVLGRLGQVATQQRPGPGGYGIYQQTSERAMTLDDVVVRTVMLLALTGISGAASWILLPPTGGIVFLAMVGSLIAGLVLGLVISFAQVTNPFVIGAYAVVEGVLLGVVSRYFENFYNGIVIQAAAATFGVFAAMAVLYKMKVLRATPKFTRFVIGALIGVVLLMFVNLAASFFIPGGLGLRGGVDGKVGWLPIVFSLVCIGVGALTFILDFDAVEQGVRYGLPERYSWYCAFGLLAGLIFVYWEILRLLSYLRR